MLGFIVVLIVLSVVLGIVSDSMRLFGEKTILNFIAALIILWLVFSFWYIILPIIFIILIGYIAYRVIRSNKETEREKQLISDVCRTGFWNFIYKGVPTRNKNETDMILNEIIKHPIIVDANIWMDKKLDCFWNDLYAQCITMKQKITIPSSVYDKFFSLKDVCIDETRFGARLALERVMMFTDSNLLNIVGIEETPNIHAYADADIIRMCDYILNKTNQKMFSLITNNKELIIRTRQILCQYKQDGELEVCKILSVGSTKYTNKWNEYSLYLKNNEHENVDFQKTKPKELEDQYRTKKN